MTQRQSKIFYWPTTTVAIIFICQKIFYNSSADASRGTALFIMYCHLTGADRLFVFYKRQKAHWNFG